MLKKIIIILLVILAAGFLFWQNLNSPVDSSGREQTFLVNKGETIKQIVNNLRTANLIRSPFYFKYQAWRGKLNIKAGEYLISPKLTAKEIIKILSAGEAVSRDKNITLIEGWDMKDMAAYLEKNQIISAGEFLKLAQIPLSSWKLSFSKADFLNDAPAKANLEGYLFPDTYRVVAGASAEQIINKMFNNFDKKLTPEMRADILAQKKTIYQIMTMASLIEKEVRTQADMKIVSGIFWDRIKYGLPLQSDASLSYILDDKIGGHTVEQTKIDSPYNTYKYRGLPFGPIANPGLNAIKAAIYPVVTEYNYFLSDPETGQTVYGQTLEEHNYNKAKYLK